MKYVMLSLCLIVLVATRVSGQMENRIEKTYDSAEITTIKINNSFGEIKVTPYEGKTIDILVVISTENSRSKRVEEFVNNVKVDAHRYGNTVELTTRRVSKTISLDGVDNFSIDYYVKMPAQTNLTINNNFGDVKIEGITGKLELNVQHGNVFIGRAESDMNKLNIQFGDLRIEEINQMQLSIQHGDITIGKGNNLNMAVQFGDSKIESISGNSAISSSHGDVSIKKVSSEIQSLVLDIQFSDLAIANFENGPYAISVTGDFIDYSWNKSWTVKEKIEDRNSYSLKLETPKGTGELKKIAIKASHSDVDLD